jgi:hypothetical protein
MEISHPQLPSMPRYRTAYQIPSGQLLIHGLASFTSATLQHCVMKYCTRAVSPRSSRISTRRLAPRQPLRHAIGKKRFQRAGLATTCAVHTQLAETVLAACGSLQCCVCPLEGGEGGSSNGMAETNRAGKVLIWSSRAVSSSCTVLIDCCSQCLLAWVEAGFDRKMAPGRDTPKLSRCL